MYVYHILTYTYTVYIYVYTYIYIYIYIQMCVGECVRVIEEEQKTYTFSSLPPWFAGGTLPSGND